ncbi:MAG: hypothetical protein HY698_07770 [Deltaproteobacteria bacterium]|nr:hypothetical protein [Deltaproteobacteria bacterium]
MRLLDSKSGSEPTVLPQHVTCQGWCPYRINDLALDWTARPPSLACLPVQNGIERPELAAGVTLAAHE